MSKAITVDMVNKRQRQLILYLHRNPEDSDKFSIYLSLNWAGLTITRVGQCLIRKGLIKKIEGDPPAYELTEKTKQFIDEFRGRGY